MLWKIGKIKKVVSLGKYEEQEVFWDWNWDFLRSLEPEPKKSLIKKVYTVCYIHKTVF